MTHIKNSSVTTAVIPAAGLGTRFLPLTKSQPKEMLPLVDKPAIQYVVEEAVHAGITDILVITGRGKRAIEDHFDRNFELDYALIERGKMKELEKLEEIESLANIHYIRQRDAKGLAHAVSIARSHVHKEPFAVMLGDDIMGEGSPLLSGMIADFEETGSSVIGMMEVEKKNISSYGCISVMPGSESAERVQVESIIEKPSIEQAPSNLAAIGRYIFTSDIFDCIDRIEPGVNGEFQLTDAIALLLADKKVYARMATDRYDVGQKVDWILANVALAMKRDDLADDVRKGLRAILDSE